MLYISHLKYILSVIYLTQRYVYKTSQLNILENVHDIKKCYYTIPMQLNSIKASCQTTYTYQKCTVNIEIFSTHSCTIKKSKPKNRGPKPVHLRMLTFFDITSSIKDIQLSHLTCTSLHNHQTGLVS